VLDELRRPGEFRPSGSSIGQDNPPRWEIVMTQRSEWPVFETIRYDEPGAAVARVTLNRPEKRNAQNLQMTYDLNAAFDHAVAQAHIKIIILAAEGPHFSAGHDLSREEAKTWRDFPIVGTWADFDSPGWEGVFSREQEIYLEITERWRNLSKPTIAQVQGKCMTGGLMLAWCCDLIVASDDAQFICTSSKMGGMGVEFWAYPWEIGPRRAKQWLMAGELSAAKALEFGMINEVVPRAQLESTTLGLAASLAERAAWSLKMIKLAVNHAQDLQGRRASMQYSFLAHQMSHLHRMQLYGTGIDTSALPENLRNKRSAGSPPGQDG
jgi:enoyl-CoA hydratase